MTGEQRARRCVQAAQAGTGSESFTQGEVGEGESGRGSAVPLL